MSGAMPIGVMLRWNEDKVSGDTGRNGRGATGYGIERGRDLKQKGLDK